LDCHLSGFANVSSMCIFTPMCNIHVSIFLMWSVGPIFLTWSVGPIRYTLEFRQTNLTHGSHVSVPPDTRVPCVGPTWHTGPTRRSDLTCGSHVSVRPDTRVPRVGLTWHAGPTGGPTWRTGPMGGPDTWVPTDRIWKGWQNIYPRAKLGIELGISPTRGAHLATRLSHRLWLKSMLLLFK
jgi:hypothetical protein